MRLLALFVLGAAATLGLAPSLEAQTALRLVGPDTWTDQSVPLEVEVRLDHDAAISTIRLAVGHDPTQIELESLTFALTEEPDPGFPNPFIEFVPGPGGVIAQIVLDEPLPPGSDTHVATLSYRALNASAVDSAVTVLFEDGVYGDPAGSNQLVLDAGGVVDAGSGLLLENYLAGILAYTIAGGEIPVGGVGTAQVMLATDVAVQGYQVSVAHPSAELILQDVTLDGTITETVGAEFVIADVEPEGAALSVILDLEAPFDGQIILPGSAQPIATYSYMCVNHPLGTPGTVHPLDFVDGVFGPFPVINVVIDDQGASLFPDVTSGSMTCGTEPFPTTTEFAIGDLDGGSVGPVFGLPGDTINLELFYTEPDFAIDGFDVALTHDCALTIESFTLVGSDIESLGVEFIATSFDSDPDDGDGCEVQVQLLLDALPPFDGQQAPASSTPASFGRLVATIPSDAVFGTSYAVDFTDGVDGEAGTPLDNGISIFGLDYTVTTVSSTVEVNIPVDPDTAFVRGDCNVDGAIDIADAITFLDEFFGAGDGVVACTEACNTNNDGALDIADAIYSLSYQFSEGPEPPAPFATCGTEAGADCASFTACP